MRRARILELVSAVLALGGGGCDERTTGPSSTGVSVSGEVLVFPTQTGVPGAVVQFRADSQVADEARVTADGSGHYVLSLSTVGSFTILVDGEYVGSGRVTGSRYRGDLLIRGGTCISRYGTLVDARTLRPVGGATVSVVGQTTISEPDGWYRIDLGCPSTGTIEIRIYASCRSRSSMISASASWAHTAAEDLLEMITRRHERALMLLTANRPADNWGKPLGETKRRSRRYSNVCCIKPMS